MAEHSEDAGTPPGSPASPRRLARRVRPDAPREPNATDMVTLARLAATMRALSAPGQAPDSGSGQATQKGHRFQRGGAPEKRGEETAPSLPATLMSTPERPWQPPAPERVVRPSRRSGQRSAKLAALRKHPFFVWAIVQIFCFGLIMLGFFLGTLENGPAPAPTPAAAPTPAPAAVVTTPAMSAPAAAAAEGALDTVSAAFEKEQTGDFTSALALLAPLAQAPSALPGTEYQLAMLALRAGDKVGAKLHLDHSLAARQQMAPCYYLCAALAGADGDFQTASMQLRLATEAEPFIGRYFFYWGEALRRNGQFPEAVAALRQALNRPSTNERVLYSFKLRLAQVEAAGKGSSIAALEERLQQPAPSGDWLLLGAAQNLQRHTFAPAAQFLQRASGLLTPETFQICVADFAFQEYASEPEVAPLLAGAAAAGAGSGDSTMIDPTVAAPATADPALWHLRKPAR